MPRSVGHVAAALSYQVPSRIYMGNSIQVDLGRIAQDLQIRRSQVESVVQLLDEGNTVPFITRYRKEATGNLNEVVIGEIQLRVQRLRELAERKETILKSIEGQGKLTPDLAAAIRAADHPKRLEDLYLPFKPKKRSKASEAREKGLEPLAFRIWTRDETLIDLAAAAQEFVNPEKGLESNEKVLEGVGHILAEAISEMAAVRDSIRRLLWKTGRIVTAKAEIPEGQGLEYRDYFDYSEPIAQIPPHRVLAINRGDKEGPLKVRLDLPRQELEGALFAQLPLEGHPHAELFSAAAIDALDRLVLPSMEREVRRDLTEGAEKHAVEVFAKNLRSLLLQPPIPKQVVMAIDPGFRTGCKVAVLDRGGLLLDHGVIYPHPPQNRRSDAKVFLKDLVGKHQVGVVAIGNGTACRETEELIAEVIAEGTLFSQNPEAAAAALEAAAKAREEARSRQPQPTPVAVTEPEPAAGSADDPNSQSLAPAESDPVDAVPEAQIDSQSGAHEGAHEEDGAPGNDHPPSDPHPPSVAETPIGALPPISGGAPDSPVPEAELESPGGSSASEAHEPAAVSADEAEHVDSGAPAMESADAPAVEANHDLIAVETEKGTPAAAEAQESASTPPPLTTAAHDPADASSGPAPAAKAESGKSTAPPLRGSRGGGGRGKSESSRNRSPRPRNTPSAPPPPQEPPRPHPADALIAQLAYVVVNEAGASVYSTSQVGREELPDFDATLRSGVSIGRRLQDPLSELVKIEPQNIGVGLYQHDINPKHLKETLETVISSCVNFVGVDLNTASVPLLRHVSGLNQLTARRIVDFRKEHGPFSGREQLQQVEGVGPATYTQAAGFLKIQDGGQPLDRTWIHPESYAIATRLLETLGYAPDVVREKDRLAELRGKLAEVDSGALSRELETGEFTLRDIIDGLGRPERDPRDDLPKPIFKKGILKIEDLAAGMELKGTVLNVVDFGAFVDIGLKDSGLVHISQLANRYVKSPHDMVSVGDVVTVWVMGVDNERKRVSLTMVKPGTERSRGPQSGGRRGGPEGDPREGQPGQNRRGAPRNPRPIASALTAPPVGAPSVAVLPETPPRRHDRDRDRPPGPGGPRSSEPRPQGPPQQDSRGPHPRQGGPGSGPPPGRGGPRGPYPGPNAGRPPRLDRGPADRSQNRPPRRPAPPPPPLSKEALEGNVPLRTFGQLKQLWEARTDEPGDLPPDSSGSAPNANIAQPSEPSAPFADNPQSTETPSPLVNEPDNQSHSS